MCYIAYFNTASHFLSVVIKTNFLGLENFCMLFIASTLPLHADRFDAPHHLLLHYFKLHGHVCGHQDQLLGVGELLLVVHCIYFASSFWSLWCAAWPIMTAMHFMTMSAATRINFLRLENFCMWFIASILPLHADHFDVLHDLLIHWYEFQRIKAPSSVDSCNQKSWLLSEKHNNNNNKNKNNNNKAIPRTALLAVKKCINRWRIRNLRRILSDFGVSYVQKWPS